MANRQELLDQWHFAWPIMNVLVGGRSSIDLPEIHIAHWEEATEFLRSYGYDPEVDSHRRKIHAAMVESLSFIEKHLMPAEWSRGLQPPAEVMQCEDARHLLVWACQRAPEQSLLRMWSCAVLRVMHTIAHIDGSYRLIPLELARDEIAARFNQAIARAEDGTLSLKGPGASVPIEKVEWKFGKTRESILLKLLHKRANVAETIYDLLGVRIITRSAIEVPLVIKVLYMSHVVSFPNAIPARSRNTLLDFDVFRASVDDLRGKLLTGKITAEDFAKRLQQLMVPAPDLGGPSNPHSGQEYRAIQLTCRQLVRFTRPITAFSRKLENPALEPRAPGGKEVQELQHVLKDLSAFAGEDEWTFFPYEIQVMDRKSYEANTSGSASHSRYKRSQIRAARRRVLSEILPLA